ncbi:hypothetical protein P775_11910 [Puniceibacterium antarcticum]|uniref:DDE domain-containing protein n=1 Tax=Puniceibacterium antarcticum TaxID=1206336 RepID=A0A2G8REY6_9RHOB|nr:hypothetical protein P775_11910 [Puniceibacterium antarcticum]
MLERGVDVSHETLRRWNVKFGPRIAHFLRRRPPRPGDVWHLDEVVVNIAGRSYWLWRAVDQHGVVLEKIVQSRRDKRAAKRLLVKLMIRWDSMHKRIITDKLRFDGVAVIPLSPSATTASKHSQRGNPQQIQLDQRTTRQLANSAS